MRVVALVGWASACSARLRQELAQARAHVRALERACEAERDAARAILVDAALVKPRYRHACALHALGRLDEAIIACDAGLALSAGHAQLIALRKRCADEVAAQSPPAQSLPVQEQEEGGAPQSEEEYALWCQATANRLYGEGEHGQACAWYTHAIGALRQQAAAAPASAPADGAAAADGAPDAAGPPGGGGGKTRSGAAWRQSPFLSMSCVCGLRRCPCVCGLTTSRRRRVASLNGDVPKISVHSRYGFNVLARM